LTLRKNEKIGSSEYYNETVPQNTVQIGSD